MQARPPMAALEAPPVAVVQGARGVPEQDPLGPLGGRVRRQPEPAQALPGRLPPVRSPVFLRQLPLLRA
jgi:hypothetical protein